MEGIGFHQSARIHQPEPTSPKEPFMGELVLPSGQLAAIGPDNLPSIDINAYHGPLIHAHLPKR